MAEDSSTRKPETEVSSRAQKKQKTEQRRYRFACSNCRRKKARCNGEYPACDKCLGSKEKCNYDQNPSPAYTASLQAQLKVYEAGFRQLRDADAEERDSLLQALTENVGQSALQPEAAAANADGNGCDGGAVSLQEKHVEGPCETSVNFDGGVCFYGETSLYHVEPQADGQHERPATDNGHDEPAIPQHLGNTARECYASPPLLKNIDQGGCSILAEISKDLLEELLAAYWCFPHHFHLVLCKRLFLRDLGPSGPYMSSFLLAAVLAQAARYTDRPDGVELGDQFARRCLELLPGAVDQGSCIPTIQAFLILSSRECACGRTAQGWLYSGMAFRMMRDLGLHVPPRKLGYLARQFSLDDLAMRQQVFWSCYTWDKTISLCLGRAPIIHDVIELPTTQTLLDGRDADEEPWVPVGARDTALHRPPARGLATHKAWSSTRFSVYCELCTIVDNILDALYSRPHCGRQAHLDYLDATRQKLRSWSAKLDSELYIPGNSPPAVCPPVHILLLNLVYHATTILLCRPYRTISSGARDSCSAAAQMIDVLFTLHVRRFGFRHITYLQTYTMFVASTINVLDYKETQRAASGLGEGPDSAAAKQLVDEAGARLDFALEVFRHANSTPSAGRCAAIICQLLVREQADKGSARDDTHRTPATTGSVEQRNNARMATPATSEAVAGNTPMPLQWLQNTPNLPLPTDRLDSMPDTDSAVNEAQSTNNLSYGVYDSHFYHGMPSGPIETPLRWLPENVQDEGTWMLMTDFDPHYTSLAAFE